MRLRNVECVGVARSFLDANSVAGSGLPSDREVRLADLKAGCFNYAPKAKNHHAWPLCLDGFSQAAWPGVIKIGHHEDFPAASSLGESPVTFGSRKRQGASPERRRLCIP